MAGTIRNTIIEAYSLQYVQTQSVSVLVKIYWAGWEVKQKDLER